MPSHSFVDITEQIGLTVPAAPEVFDAESMTGGAAVVDFDRDGDYDIHVLRVNAPDHLFRNDGGLFRDVASEIGLRGQPSGSSMAVWGDVNADDVPDVYVTSISGIAGTLHMGQPDGTFTEARANGGFPTNPDPATNVFGATLADVDNDGDLDLWTSQWDIAGVDPGDIDDTCNESRPVRRIGSQHNRSHLYLNDLDGVFAEATVAFGVDLARVLAFSAMMTDLNGDGFLDVSVTGDACTSQLLVGDGAQFRNETELLTSDGATLAKNAMGQAIGDVNGDGLLDIMVTGVNHELVDGVCPFVGGLAGCGGNRLYLRNADGTFSEESEAAGVRDGAWGWGVAIADFDNDGDNDIAQANGFNSAIDASEFDVFRTDKFRLWLNGGRTQFTKSAADLGIDLAGQSKAVLPFDFDDDGDLDLLISNANGGPRLLRNDLNLGDRKWLRIQLDDPSAPGNRRAIGARVEVLVGESVRVQEVRGGGEFAGQLPPEIHVGLGDHAGSVRVEVTWPGTTEVEVFDDVSPNQRAILTRGLGLATTIKVRPSSS